MESWFMRFAIGLILCFGLVSCHRFNDVHLDNMVAQEVKEIEVSLPVDAFPLFDEVAADAFAAYDAVGTLVVSYGARSWVYADANDLGRADRRYIVASTFKIPHSIIALDTGVADLDSVYQWDGQERFVKSWNQNQLFPDAFHRSAVWVYQEIAPQIGQARMQHYLDDFDYGNCEIGEADSIDQFWLSGQLKASAYEQIHFLQKFNNQKLPIKSETYASMKALMVVQNHDFGHDVVLRAKTGWEVASDPDIGWYVGFLEKGENTYYFAMNMDIVNAEDRYARKKIVQNVFTELGIAENAPKNKL